MSTNNGRPASENFLPCGNTRMSKNDKVNMAMLLYLTLEAVNESAPRGCDGMPMDLMVAVGGKGLSVQKLLKDKLVFLRSPLPPDPEPEFEEGCCGCGNPLHPDAVN